MLKPRTHVPKQLEALSSLQQMSVHETSSICDTIKLVSFAIKLAGDYSQRHNYREIVQHSNTFELINKCRSRCSGLKCASVLDYVKSM